MRPNKEDEKDLQSKQNKFETPGSKHAPEPPAEKPDRCCVYDDKTNTNFCGDVKATVRWLLQKERSSSEPEITEDVLTKESLITICKARGAHFYFDESEK